jgi:hypothetical protein
MLPTAPVLQRPRPSAATPTWLFIVSAATLGLGVRAHAAPPELYRRAGYESPVRADPDDLLLLAGYGFKADDTVVYEALDNADGPRSRAPHLPTESTANAGVADVVSSKDVPYSLTIRLPAVMRQDLAYALRVRTSHGEWSVSLPINDARPRWLTPAYAYVSGMPAHLPRELKVVGENLGSGAEHTTQIRLLGPEQVTGTAIAGGPSDASLADYVARLGLPDRLSVGHYHVQVRRKGGDWVSLQGQTFEVRPDPAPPLEFPVDDPRYGGCHPDDGMDDTGCIVHAIAAAGRAGGGRVTFGAGSWDLIGPVRPGSVGAGGIMVPAHVELHGAGATQTRLNRHAEWSARGPTPAFILVGPTLVSGFTFGDVEIYRSEAPLNAFIQLGAGWQRAVAAADPGGDVVSGVTITDNVFDKTNVAIGSGGLPIDRLFITGNTFGAYTSSLELSGDQLNSSRPFRLDDSVIDGNLFKPSSKLNLSQKTGPLATEVGAGLRVDFSGNTADGASTDYLYAPDDARGWRAAFFWNPNNNQEDVLISQNVATCTGDKIGDGEAISLDNNTNTFALSSAATVSAAGPNRVAVTVPLAARQHGQEIPVASYYVGHWVQVVSGPGLGQVRKIAGYTIDPGSHVTTFNIAPAWDVTPASGVSRITIGREYWHVNVLDNQIDNRKPLCQKSNRSRHAAGMIALWAQSADSVIAGNRQFDSDGIFVQQVYATPEHPCKDCSMQGYFHSFLQVRDNLIDGEYDWSSDCSVSGISMGLGAATWSETPPPTVGFGNSIAHNTVRHADGQSGGAIGQLDSWSAGPAPHRWPLSDNLSIHHNDLSDVEDPRASAQCGHSRPRAGIAFPEEGTAWHTVLYANSCRHVTLPVGGGGVDTVAVCPSSRPDSCECR